MESAGPRISVHRVDGECTLTLYVDGKAAQDDKRYGIAVQLPEGANTMFVVLYTGNNALVYAPVDTDRMIATAELRGDLCEFVEAQGRAPVGQRPTGAIGERM